MFKLVWIAAIEWILDIDLEKMGILQKHEWGTRVRARMATYIWQYFLLQHIDLPICEVQFTRRPRLWPSLDIHGEAMHVC